MSIFDTDPAILSLDPSKVYQIISLLPEEMVRYELETQGIRCAKGLATCRSQLSKRIKDRLYKRNSQPVAIGIKEDIGFCMKHLDRWREELESSENSPISVNHCINRMKFLTRRVEDIDTDNADADVLSLYYSLKSQVALFDNYLKVLEQIQPIEVPRTSFDSKDIRDIENWTLHSTSYQLPSNSLSNFQPLQRNETARTTDFWSSFPTPENANRASLNASLDFMNDSVMRNKSRFDKPLSKANSTAKATNPIPLSNETVTLSHSPYKNKVKIWEWHLKFLGEPNTLPVFEFIRRVHELAKARGANKTDLFNGAVDLFAGSGLRWLRAGLKKKSFVNWDELEAQLLIEFEAYDYGENLLDYIKGRMQKPNERIVIYFATMEDLFMKLGSFVSDHLQINIIRNNLRPEFIRGLGCIQVHSLGELKSLCQSLENDFRRLANRNNNSNSKGPDPNAKSVRFSEKVLMLEQCPYESDYSRYEGNNDWENRYSSSRPYRNRSPSPSRDKLEAEFIDRRILELSERKESNLPNFTVPPPEVALSYTPVDNTNLLYQNDAPFQNNNQNRYFAPQRSNVGSNPTPLNYPSGNEQGRFNGTSSTPLVIRRPM